METSGVSQTLTTAAFSKAINAQSVEVAMILNMLQRIQEMQMQMMQSLGIGQNVDVAA